MAICKQEDYGLVLNTKLLVQALQVFSEVIFSISPSQDDFKYLRMQTNIKNRQMNLRHNDNFETQFELNWMKGFGLASIHQYIYALRSFQTITFVQTYRIAILKFDCPLYSPSLFILPLQVNSFHEKLLKEEHSLSKILQYQSQ